MSHLERVGALKYRKQSHDIIGYSKLKYNMTSQDVFESNNLHSRVSRLVHADKAIFESNREIYVDVFDIG